MEGSKRVATLLILFYLLPFLAAAQETKPVQIAIINSKFEYHGGRLKPDMPGTVRVRNQDEIQHGFASALFEEHSVRVESKGTVIYGTGIKGVYINPGEVVQFHFTPARPGKFTFRCDLHPAMEGEILMLSIDIT